MGCDIHLVLERKYDDEWLAFNTFDYIDRTCIGVATADGFPWVGWTIRQRNYALFNDLAGVRGDGSTFGYIPRGFPDDAARLTRKLAENWGLDGHSHSWLTLAEALPVFVKHHYDVKEAVKKRLQGRDERGVWARELFNVALDEESIDNWRIVFWFDN